MYRISFIFRPGDTGFLPPLKGVGFRPGTSVILLERLRREALLLWLLHVVEEAFGVADVTYTERDVEYELAM